MDQPLFSGSIISTARSITLSRSFTTATTISARTGAARLGPLIICTATRITSTVLIFTAKGLTAAFRGDIISCGAFSRGSNGSKSAAFSTAALAATYVSISTSPSSALICYAAAVSGCSSHSYRITGGFLRTRKRVATKPAVSSITVPAFEGHYISASAAKLTASAAAVTELAAYVTKPGLIIVTFPASTGAFTAVHWATVFIGRSTGTPSLRQTSH